MPTVSPCVCPGSPKVFLPGPGLFTFLPVLKRCGGGRMRVLALALAALARSSSGYGSQVGQDDAVLRLFAPLLAAQMRRHMPPTLFFVDVAANSPLLFSNTVRLEDTGAWRGLCVDASMQSAEDFKTYRRSCKFVQALLGKPGSTVLYRELRMPYNAWLHRAAATHAWLHGVSGIVPSPKAPTIWVGDGNVTHSLSVAELRALGIYVRHYTMQTSTAVQLLDAHHAPSVVDYMSLDVEGEEENVLRDLWGGDSTRYHVAVLTIERPTAMSKEILRRAGMRFNASLGRFGEELWVNATLLASRLVEQRPAQAPYADIPLDLQFTCKRNVQVSGGCIGGRCPFKDIEIERCRAMCSTRRTCSSFIHNKYGACFLKDGDLFAGADDPVHQTIACAKLQTVAKHAAVWRKKTWPFSGFYRLSDILRCSHVLDPLSESAFPCGGLDAVNIRRLWPGSLGDEYSRHVSLPTRPRHEERHLAPRMSALASVLESRMHAGFSCGEPPPVASSCVFHIRMGDVFRDCDGRSLDCTNRSAADLWSGDPHGKAWSTTAGEEMIQNRAHFEHALNRLPKWASTIVITAASTAAGPWLGKEREYIELLSALVRSRGLRVRRRVQATAPSDGFNHTKVDCDFLFMSAAACYLPSGGGFSNLVANFVQHRGGFILGTSRRTSHAFKPRSSSHDT